MPAIDISLEEAKAIGALPVFSRCLRPALDQSRKAFQRGLGEAATCTQALLTFDDAGAAILSFDVQLPGGASHVFSEAVTTRAEELHTQTEERGAAAATAIKAGLIKPGRGSVRL